MPQYRTFYRLELQDHVEACQALGNVSLATRKTALDDFSNLPELRQIDQVGPL